MDKMFPSKAEFESIPEDGVFESQHSASDEFSFSNAEISRFNSLYFLIKLNIEQYRANLKMKK